MTAEDLIETLRQMDPEAVVVLVHQEQPRRAWPIGDVVESGARVYLSASSPYGTQPPPASAMADLGW